MALRELRPSAGADRPVTADDDAWVTFAPGPSPTPAAAAVTHGVAVAFVEAGADAGRVTARDRVLAAGPDRRGANDAEMWIAWRVGAVLVPAPRSLARAGTERHRWLAERRVNVVLESPSPQVQSITPE